MMFTRHITVTDSEQVSLILYNPENREMVIHFRNGAQYRYRDVPDATVGSLVTASSVGKALNELRGSLSKYERIA